MEPVQGEKKIMEETEKIGRVTAFLSSVGIVERTTKVMISLLLLFVVFSAFVSFLLMPPFGFPEGKMITIKKGDTLETVSALFNKENLIRSPFFFEICAKIVGGTKPVTAGQYVFKESLSACRIAIRIARGISGIPAIPVTIPEGMSNKQIAAVIAKDIPGFDTALFLEHARAQEGFLFPDTYFFPENVTTQGVETTMTANFNKRIESWKKAIEASKHSLREVIIMASILEKEATTEEDKAIVSGILWKRISIGMPLQVDASFLYLFDKKSSDVTVADKRVKSTYNTYLNKGLPGGPIGNPGIAAIRAAVQPTSSQYLYYLSDNDGGMHYAKTFDEHIANKEKYLK